MSQSEKPTNPDNQQDGENLPPLTFIQMLGSTLSAALGVQSERNRERDFSRGKASHFILMGIGFTVVFVIVMALIVKLVLAQIA